MNHPEPIPRLRPCPSLKTTPTSALGRPLPDSRPCCNAVVDLHNYRESLSAQRKKENWVVLNQKVLKKIGVDVDKHEIELLCSGTDNAAEK